MTHVGRYEIVAELGRGAMGVVYKALDPSIGRTVAIKAIRLSEFQDSDERERIHQRLWREARSAGVLSHPNIVTIYDVLEQDSAAYIVMECVDGPSLAHLYRRGALPRQAELLRYLRQVAEALDYAHQKGVVHRDVKPGNIIISDGSSDGPSLAKMADFGVAKFISQETTHSGTMIGTPSYLSPEQIEGVASDGRSDQFSLAVVIYELLTNQKPFDSENLSGLFYQICKQTPKPADQLNPLLPPTVGKLLARGLAKEPDQRFATCTDLIAALESSLSVGEVRTDKKIEPIPELPPFRARRFRAEETDSTSSPKRRPVIAGIIAGLFAVSAGVGVVWQRHRSTVVAAPYKAVPAPPVLIPKTDRSPKPGQTAVRVPTETTATQLPASRQSTIPVVIRTEPPGAVVQIDGQAESECKSPCDLRLNSGRHTLSASEAGYTLARRIFNVPEESDVSIVLERSVGVLLVTSEPSGSAVTVDGKPSGQTPVTLHLPAGAHQVVLTNGAQRHEESVTVISDDFISRNLRWQ